MDNIVITTLPIACERESVFAMAKRDRPLINSICKFAKRLREEGIEVFARKENIIATEKGYFLAFFEKDLAEVQKEQEEKPFIGEDGRQKVKLIDNEGKEHIEDVAELVAKTFVPNPFNYPYVRFKDNNPLNCNKSNLYWSDVK